MLLHISWLPAPADSGFGSMQCAHFLEPSYQGSKVLTTLPRFMLCALWMELGVCSCAVLLTKRFWPIVTTLTRSVSVCPMKVHCQKAPALQHHSYHEDSRQTLTMLTGCLLCVQFQWCFANRRLCTFNFFLHKRCRSIYWHLQQNLCCVQFPWSPVTRRLCLESFKSMPTSTTCLTSPSSKPAAFLVSHPFW